MIKRLLAIFLVSCLLFGICAVPQAAAAHEKNAEATAHWDCDGDGVLSILAIGNSFARDTMQYVWDIGNSLGVDKIVLGTLFLSGASLNDHAENVANNTAAYTYYYNDSGTWTSKSSYKISTALASRNWDYVSLQQVSGSSGVASTYNSDLTDLIAYVKGRIGDSTRLIWNMTWAYQGNSTHSSFPTYNNNQKTMYNSIVAAVKSKILTNDDIDMVIPTGTAAQNARSSLIGDTITRDGYHMSLDFGRYLVGLMLVKCITDLPVESSTYKPSGVSDSQRHIAAESVNHAAKTPFAVTASSYTGSAPKDGFAQFPPTLTRAAYWHSGTAAPASALVSTTDRASRFYATELFTRELLPVGSVIMVSSGWNYRPDGWEDTNSTSTVRPAQTDVTYTIVTEEWWGDYAVRGFNISKADQSSLSSVSEATIHGAFRIYVPEATLSQRYVQLRLPLTRGAYWNPSHETYYNRLITSSSISQYFCATARFNKTQLPVNSIILVKDGWQYRPDGWVTDTLQEDRADITTQTSTVVTSSWWGSYTIRAFNLSMVDRVSLTDTSLSTLESAFRIYVPKSKHTHSYEAVVTPPTCMSEGYTTYSCTTCYDSYVSDVTETTTHSYADGVCICGAKLADLLTFKSATVTLESDLSLNYYVEKSALEGFTDPYVTFQKAVYDESGNVSEYEETAVTEYAEKTAADGTECYVFTFTGISAKEMSSAVSVTLSGSYEGTVYSGNAVSYSVKQYAENLLAATEDAALRTLLVDMLNYGAEAQIYFAYNTANLANADLTEEQKAWASQEELSLMSSLSVNDNEGQSIYFESAALLLEEKVTMNFYLDLDEYTGAVEDLYARVFFENAKGELVEYTIEGTELTELNGDHVLYFDGLNAAQMRSIIGVELYSRQTASCISPTLYYSIETYAHNKLADTSLAELVTAMMRYGDSVAAYAAR